MEATTTPMVFGLTLEGLLGRGLMLAVAIVVAGLGLMAGRVVQPGDAVEISGFAGVVTDVNWRSTTVRDRNGCEQVIPNAVLNKTALTRLTPTSSTLVDLVMAVRADADPREVERFLLEACTSELGDTLVAGQPACVAFTGSDAYGVECHVYMHVRPDAGAAGARDAVMRRVMGQPWLACA